MRKCLDASALSKMKHTGLLCIYFVNCAMLIVNDHFVNVLFIKCLGAPIPFKNEAYRPAMYFVKLCDVNSAMTRLLMSYLLQEC